MQPLLFVVVLILGLSLAEEREGLNVFLKGMNDDLDDMKKDLEEKIKRDIEIMPEPEEAWMGKWFPARTQSTTEKPKTVVHKTSKPTSMIPTSAVPLSTAPTAVPMSNELTTVVPVSIVPSTAGYVSAVPTSALSTTLMPEHKIGPPTTPYPTNSAASTARNVSAVPTPALSTTPVMPEHKIGPPTTPYPTDSAASTVRVEPVESWTGKWFPDITTAAPSKVPSAVPAAGGMDGNNMWQMINSTCDDGKQNLTVDWEPNSFDYECEGPYLEPDLSVKATLEQEYIPPAYVARHVCMKSKIPYNQLLPTFGPHRPAWAKYGEYTYLPIQRFLHNMEHGAVIMLYHPCTHPALVNKLKKIVKSCLYRHVITASRLVPRDRPLALMTWGWRLLMPTVDTSLAVQFIREHALHGYEKTHRDGFYDQLLMAPAAIVSTPDDQEICPRFKGV